jgi:hypothetical protein
VSIRLLEGAGLLEVTTGPPINEGAIDKNWGEIDKKCWTGVCGDFTLEADQ